jgi:hypothetical protein
MNKQLTKEQKLICVPVLAQLLMDFTEDCMDEYPTIFRHNLKRTANTMVGESEKILAHLYGSFDSTDEGQQARKLAVSNDQSKLANSIRQHIARVLVLTLSSDD